MEILSSDEGEPANWRQVYGVVGGLPFPSELNAQAKELSSRVDLAQMAESHPIDALIALRVMASATCYWGDASEAGRLAGALPKLTRRIRDRATDSDESLARVGLVLDSAMLLARAVDPQDPARVYAEYLVAIGTSSREVRPVVLRLALYLARGFPSPGFLHFTSAAYQLRTVSC